MDSTQAQIRLRPATLADRRRIFEWLAHSDITRSMLGPPDFPDAPIPSWAEFITDYIEHYFTASDPRAGCCYVIERTKEAIGQINHSAIIEGATELDIWLRGEELTGLGYGSQAIQILCEHLFKTYSCQRFYIAPSRRNKRAVRAYEKAGFVETADLPEGFNPDYEDTLVMQKEFEPDV